MGIDFPNSPTAGDVVSVGGRSWQWSGAVWKAIGTIQGTVGSQGVQGTRGIQGNQGVQGTKGTQGTLGVQGIQGPQGTVQGLQGVSIQGIDGIGGIQGPYGQSTPIASPSYTATTEYFDALPLPRASAIAAADTVYLLPVAFYKRITIKSLSFELTSSNTGAVELGIYNYNLTTNLPGSQITEGTASYNLTLSLATEFVEVSFTTPVTLEAGLYFLGAHFDDTPTIAWYNGLNEFFIDDAIALSSGAGGIINGFTDPALALPSTPSVTGVARCPRIVVGI